MIILIVCLILLSFYIILFLLYLIGWLSISKHKRHNDSDVNVMLSIIIAARNEEKNIEKCLHAILNQKYPQNLFEIIVVNDHSTDRTLELIKSISSTRIKVISLEEFCKQDDKIISYKKKALSVGIEQAKGKLIVCTDADCWMEENWLYTIADFYNTYCHAMIVAPVKYHIQPSFLGLFQAIDFLTMQGVTAATVSLNLGIMCNGANLIFEKESFYKVGGYEGFNHIVSGDDYLLQYKFKTQLGSNTVGYLKSIDAIVYTYPQPTWVKFFQQRVRWASKTGKYKDYKVLVALLIVYLFNVSLLLLLLYAMFLPNFWQYLGYVLVIKTIVELIFIYSVSAFYKSKKWLYYFPLLQPFHIVYIVMAGFLSRFQHFEWKQRKF